MRQIWDECDTGDAVLPGSGKACGVKSSEVELMALTISAHNAKLVLYSMLQDIENHSLATKALLCS